MTIINCETNENILKKLLTVIPEIKCSADGDNTVYLKITKGVIAIDPVTNSISLIMRKVETFSDYGECMK